MPQKALNPCGIIATRALPAEDGEFSRYKMREVFPAGLLQPASRTLHAAWENYMFECIHPGGDNHTQHLFKTPGGIFITWEDDWECGCCEAEESDRCYTYTELTKEAALQMVASNFYAFHSEAGKLSPPKMKQLDAYLGQHF